MSLKVHIAVGADLFPEISYAWEQFAFYAGIRFAYVENPGDIVIGFGVEADIQIATLVADNLRAGRFAHTDWFSDEPLVYTESGKPDYLGTVFYMLSCAQEYAVSEKDALGRFRYTDSWQHRFNCTEQQLVGTYFDRLLQQVPKLQSFISEKAPSRLLLTHDNDTFYGSFLQDGLFALRKGRADILFRLVVNEILRKPDWFNLDRIMDVEDAYGVRSVFFWLVNKGKPNADYHIRSSAVRNQMERIAKRGWEQGLHKSISAESFQQEIDKLGFPVTANRNHFLKFSLPDHFDAIQEAGLQLDCSLGFAEKPGFRNGYGLPYRPYNLKDRKPYDFLEVPLHIMDTTFFGYERLPVKEVQQRILDFLEQHKTGNVLSVLWHNNFFSSYKFSGYLEIYKSILEFAREHHMESVSTEELFHTYYR